MLKITSPANPKIKQLVKLRTHSYRQETQSFLVEGIREIRCALEHYGQAEEIYFCPELISDSTKAMLSRESNANIVEISRDCFAKAAVRSERDGVLVIFKQKKAPNPDQVLQKVGKTLGLVIAGVEKPGNIGAMLRTADGLGIHWVILSQCGTDLYNPNLIRASLGAVFSLPILCLKTHEKSLRLLKEKSVNSYALALTDKAKELYKTRFADRSALVVGREDLGLDDLWLDQSTETLIIPMRGTVDSLNVASSAAIALAFASAQIIA